MKVALAHAHEANQRIVEQLNDQVDFLNEQLALRETQLDKVCKCVCVCVSMRLCLRLCPTYFELRRKNSIPSTCTFCWCKIFRKFTRCQECVSTPCFLLFFYSDGPQFQAAQRQARITRLKSLAASNQPRPLFTCHLESLPALNHRLH